MVFLGGRGYNRAISGGVGGRQWRMTMRRTATANKKIVDAAPPLTPAQRARLRVLLSPVAVDLRIDQSKK
jgi:hypothetical protein